MSDARPAYTLTGMAALRQRAQGQWTMDLDRFVTNAEVPRNTLYHPVKCPAEAWKARLDKIRNMERKGSMCTAVLISGQMSRVRA